MTASPHRIRRLRVQMPARSREAAFALRARLRDLVGEIVLPSLVQVFDDVAPGDEIVHIARLELHARVSRIEELASVLPELARRELAASRGPGRAAIRSMQAAVPSPGAGARSIAEALPLEATEERPVRGRRRSTPDDRVRAIEHYLETGAFPWHVDAENTIRAFIADLSIEELARAAAGRVAERSPEVSIALYFRLLQLVPPSSWTLVAREILDAIGAPEAAPVIETVSALAEAGDLARHVRLRAAAVAMAFAGTDPARSDAERSEAPRGEERPARGDRVRAIEHYLETGRLPRHADAEGAIFAFVADLSIEELARSAAGRVLHHPPGVSLAVYFRLLQLVPPSSWTLMAREILDVIGVPEAARAIEAVAALAGASDLAPHVRLRAAAAAVAVVRTHSAQADADRNDVPQSQVEGSTHGDRVRAIEDYLETGTLARHADPEDTSIPPVAELSIEELARAAAGRVLDRSPGVSLAVYFRLLQLVPPSSWALVAREILDVIGVPEAALAIETVATLAGASDLAPHVRLRAAAATVAFARTCSARADADRNDVPQSQVERSTRRDRVRAIEHYLETGTLPRHADPESTIFLPVAELSIEELARAVAGGVLEGSPEAPSGAYARLLQLVPRSSWASMTQALLAAAGASEAPPASDAVAAPAEAGDVARPSRRRAASARSVAVERERLSSPTPAAVASQPLPAARASSPAATGRPVEEPFGIAACYAGLILLHPFLARLFESTGVRRPGQPALDEAALPRAAALLHACATGEDEPFEYELAFIKILLGLAPEAPLLVAGGLLSEADREEVDGLLRAVIAHWAALKNTSAHGLRSTFLRRGGLVREEPQGFRLQVEPAGFDVLLAQLPWGIATVKLAWMRKAIFTEWPTS